MPLRGRSAYLHLDVPSSNLSESASFTNGVGAASVHLRRQLHFYMLGVLAALVTVVSIWRFLQADFMTVTTERLAGVVWDSTTLFDASSVKGIAWERVLSFRSKHRRGANTTETLSAWRRALQNSRFLSRVIDIMHMNGYPVILAAGTVLGRFREGSTIIGPHEDLDLLMPRSWFLDDEHVDRFMMSMREAGAEAYLKYGRAGEPALEFQLSDPQHPLLHCDVFVIDEYHQNMDGSFSPGCFQQPCAWAHYIDWGDWGREGKMNLSTESQIAICPHDQYNFQLVSFVGRAVWAADPEMAQLSPQYGAESEFMVPKSQQTIGYYLACRRPKTLMMTNGSVVKLSGIYPWVDRKSFSFVVSQGFPTMEYVMEKQRTAEKHFTSQIKADHEREVLEILAVMERVLMLAEQPRQGPLEGCAGCSRILDVYRACSGGPCVGECRASVQRELLLGGLWRQEELWPLWRVMSAAEATQNESLIDWAAKCDWNGFGY